MRFTSIVACLATVSSAVAQSIAFTSTPKEVQAGETYTIQWTPASGVDSVSIVLRWGESDDLNPGNVLASNLQNTNSYQWSVPANLFNYDEGEKDTHYAFQIKYTIDGKEESNYSAPIQVSGGKDFTSADKSTSTSTDDEDTTSTVTETTDMTTTMTTTALDSSSTDDEESSNSTTTTDARRTTTRTTTTAEDATATDDSAAETTSSAPSGGSVARSSSLAMVFCILAAVFYLN